MSSSMREISNRVGVLDIGTTYEIQSFTNEIRKLDEVIREGGSEFRYADKYYYTHCNKSPSARVFVGFGRTSDEGVPHYEKNQTYLTINLEYRPYKLDEYFDRYKAYVIKVDKAIITVEPDKECGRKKNVSIRFIGKDGKEVFELKGSTWERLAKMKDKEFFLTKDAYEEVKIEKKVGARYTGGCMFCDHSEYEKENGIIYIKCTKYEGRVKETEYDATEYPSYCKRRD